MQDQLISVVEELAQAVSPARWRYSLANFAGGIRWHLQLDVAVIKQQCLVRVRVGKVLRPTGPRPQLRFDHAIGNLRGRGLLEGMRRVVAQ